jgi:phosphoglycolate phosphatase
MRYKLALFDFDGTLADSSEWFLTHLNEIADELKLRRIEPEDFEKVRGYSSEQIIEHLGVPMWKVPVLIRRMRRAAAESNGAIRLFDGVPKMLKGLAGQGITIGIVSSNVETNIRATLGDQASHIRHFACGASLFGKASKLKALLRRTRFGPEDAIYIGDEIRDSVAAKEVGMAFGAVAWGFTTAEALRRTNPVLEFKSVEEIVSKLK